MFVMILLRVWSLQEIMCAWKKDLVGVCVCTCLCVCVCVYFWIRDIHMNSWVRDIQTTRWVHDGVVTHYCACVCVCCNRLQFVAECSSVLHCVAALVCCIAIMACVLPAGKCVRMQGGAIRCGYAFVCLCMCELLSSWYTHDCMSSWHADDSLSSWHSLSIERWVIVTWTSHISSMTSTLDGRLVSFVISLMTTLHY